MRSAASPTHGTAHTIAAQAGPQGAVRLILLWHPLLAKLGVGKVQSKLEASTQLLPSNMERHACITEAALPLCYLLSSR
jgi:hypothetical protein